MTTVGRVHPHLEAKVVDHMSGALLPRGVVGELCVRGYSTMLGYWGDAEATAAVLDKVRMWGKDCALADQAFVCMPERLVGGVAHDMTVLLLPLSPSSDAVCELEARSESWRHPSAVAHAGRVDAHRRPGHP